MKKLTCKTEGVWIDVTENGLTEAEKSTLITGTSEEKTVIGAKLRGYVAPEITGDEAVAAEAIYTDKKPTLKDTDTYQLIACDVTVEGNTLTGILNCRVNGEHIQVRF